MNSTEQEIKLEPQWNLKSTYQQCKEVLILYELCKRRPSNCDVSRKYRLEKAVDYCKKNGLY